MAKRDDVGYGRPPAESQFRPGQSGNPKGRPKGAVGFASMMRRVANERVTITENGRRRTITKIELCMKQLINKAAAGGERSLAFLLSTVQTIELKPVDVANPLDTAADRAVMASLAKRFAKTLERAETDAEDPS